MTGTLQPLDSKFAIVDARGNPTDYFTRWAQQKQIDIGDSITLTDLTNYLAAHKLIAGTGIQLTPDGNIADGVTIHADVQAILDEVTATRGAILYRGLLGWAALLPGTATYLLQTNGAGADPSWVAPPSGGGGYSFEGFGNLLTIAGLTNIPAASANITKTDGTKAHKFSWTASGSNTIQGATMAAPATPWNLYCRFIPAKNTFAGNVQFGLITRNSTSGKLILFAFNSNTNISVQNWTNPTTFSSQVTVVSSQPIYWLRINNDGTNLNFYTGTNGIDWDLFSTQTLASFMSSVDQAGLGGVPFAAAAAWVSDFGFTTPV